MELFQSPEMAAPSTPTCLDRRGLMLVLSSPSGAGKSTLANALVGSEPQTSLAVSMTTRPKRPDEVDGKDYFFVGKAEFRRYVADGAFLEWARVFDHLYGTPNAAVDELLKTGSDIIYDIDWQGSQQLRKLAPDDVVSVFILPPSVAALEQRLMARGQDAIDVVKRRMQGSLREISHWEEYDYVIINDTIPLAHARLKSILESERIRRHRQTGLAGYVRSFETENV